MKKIFFSAAFAIAMAFAATDASAQQVIGKTSSSDRPMPTNSEITRQQEGNVTDGQPFQQIRANETDSDRNRENMEVIKSNPAKNESMQGDPAQRTDMPKEKRREMDKNRSSK